MNIIEKSKKLSVLIERKMNLQSALEYMRKEAMIGQATARYEWKYNSLAADCIEKELDNVIEEITRIENEV